MSIVYDERRKDVVVNGDQPTGHSWLSLTVLRSRKGREV